MQLYNAGMTSQNAAIRTFTAGSSLVDAEGVVRERLNMTSPLRHLLIVIKKSRGQTMRITQVHEGPGSLLDSRCSFS